MPQIGWFEILVVVILAILIIGPKDFPIVLKKMGNWIGTIRRYFTNFQKDMTDFENTIEEKIISEDNIIKNKDTKKDES
jgi:sec-independent protein translocase protein TatB